MMTRQTQVQELREGQEILFTRGQDTEQQRGIVRSVEVSGKYVTIWYNDKTTNELSMVLSEKGENITRVAGSRK